MESAKAHVDSSGTTEKTFHLPVPKIFFSKSRSQISATVPAQDIQPQVSAGSTRPVKCSEISEKLSVGSRVIVGGVKEGILRFLGRVHFMEGDWCGVELDEPEGLHDGTVEQVRYFTCKNGHGLFAPQSKVSLMHDRKAPDQKSMTWQRTRCGGDAEFQFPHVRSGSLESVTNSLIAGEQVQIQEKLLKPSKLARPRSVFASVESDLKEASYQSKLPRPKSALVSLAYTESNPDGNRQMRRSSLLDFAALATQHRSSPKRVTFDDTIEYDLSSPCLSAARLRKFDLQGEGYASDEGSYDSAMPHTRFNPYMALTLTYDLESSPPRKKTTPIMKLEGLKTPVEKIKIATSVETQQLTSIQLVPDAEMVKNAGANGDSNQGSSDQLLHDIFARMDEEISNIPTPDTAEMIIPGSLSSSEEDARRMFASDSRGLAFPLDQKKQAKADSDRRLSRCSVTEDDQRSSETRGCKMRAEGNHSDSTEELGLKVGVQSVISGNIGGELQALTKKASFELARTALAQYADLIRAAQEDRTHRLTKASVKPKPQPCSAAESSLEETSRAEPYLEESTESLRGDSFDPSWSRDRADRVKTFEDVELSDSVDSLNCDLNESLSSAHHDGLDEYETFEGEDLRMIKAEDVIVDSEEEFIEGERLAMSGELDLEDSLIIESRPLFNKPFQHPTADPHDVDGNLDPSLIPAPPESIGQMSEEYWNNTVNNMRQYENEAGTVCPLVQLRRKQQPRPVSMLSTASSDAGIGDDLVPGYGLKHDRPISLISSTSSTDTGCPMEVDSEMLSSTMLSSTLDDLTGSWPEPGSTSSTANWLKSYGEPDVEEKQEGEKRLDYQATVLPVDGNAGLEVHLTGIDCEMINIEKDQKRPEKVEISGEVLLAETGEISVENKLPEKQLDQRKKTVEKSFEKTDSVLLKTNSNLIQKDPILSPSSLVTDSTGPSRDDQPVAPEKLLSRAEFPQKLASENVGSLQVEISSKDVISSADKWPDVQFPSDIQHNLCHGLELTEDPVTGRKKCAARLTGDNEESGFTPENLISSKDACLEKKSINTDEVQLENKSVDMKKTESEHCGSSIGVSVVEEKGSTEQRMQLENLVTSVKEGHRKDIVSLDGCHSDFLVEKCVNPEEARLEETFSSKEEIKMNEQVSSYENIQLRENTLSTEEIIQEDLVKAMLQEKTGHNEEGQADQMMSESVASISPCKETVEDRGKDIYLLEQEPRLTDSLQKLAEEPSCDFMPNDSGDSEGKKEETDDSDGLIQDVVRRQEPLEIVRDKQSHGFCPQVMVGSGTMQEVIILDSGMIAATGLASESPLSGNIVSRAAEMSETISEVAETASVSGLDELSDTVLRTREGSDAVSLKTESKKNLPEDQEIVTDVSRKEEGSETVSALAGGSDTVSGLSKSNDNGSGLAEGNDAKSDLVESMDTVSETTGSGNIEQGLLEPGKANESDLMQQTEAIIQSHISDGSSDPKTEVVKNSAVKKVLEPERNDETNEVSRLSTEITNDASGDSEVSGKVGDNLQDKRASETVVNDGGNISKETMTGYSKTPSKLLAMGVVKGATGVVKGEVSAGRVKTKQGKTDDNKDTKDDSNVGNGKETQQPHNIGKTNSGSITSKTDTISGNIKLSKTSSDISRNVKGDSGVENGNMRQRLNASRKVKSSSAYVRDVTSFQNTKMNRGQSDVGRNAKDDSDRAAGNAIIKNRNKNLHSEQPTDLQSISKKRSSSVSEPIKNSVGKDSAVSASKSSDDSGIGSEKRSGIAVKLSVVHDTSAVNSSGAKVIIKSRQHKELESAAKQLDVKGKILDGDVAKDAMPQKASVVHTDVLSTTAPRKTSAVPPKSMLPSSDRAKGRKSFSSQDTLVDVKMAAAQDKFKTSNGKTNPSPNPGSKLVAQKNGGRGRGGVSGATKSVNAVPEKFSPLMKSKKQSVTKPVTVNLLSNPGSSSQQSSKAANGKSSVTRGSLSSISASKQGLANPGSVVGRSDGGKTLLKKQKKELGTTKPSTKKPLTAAVKEIKPKLQMLSDAGSVHDLAKQHLFTTCFPDQRCNALSVIQSTESSPQLALQVDELKSQLKQSQQQLEGVVKEREELQLTVAKMKEEQSVEIKGIRKKHQQEIDSLKKAFVLQTKTEIEKVVDQHSHEVRTLKSYHDRHLSEAKQEHNAALEAREKEFEDAITKLKAEHLKELNETKASHEQQLNEISERFEEIKISLSSKVEQLRSKCDELCSRELCYKDTCKRESDLREQAALEVDSLRVILEQKNGEIRKLRQQNALMDEKIQDIPWLKEAITKLQQKIENLEAVNNLKSDNEKQLAEMHQVLLRKFERESKAMKRLSMENEELMWRLSQSDFGPSCLEEKLPTALSGVSLMSRSYDSQQAAAMTHRTRLRADVNQEAIMSRSFDGFSDFYPSAVEVSSRETEAQSAQSSSSSSSAFGGSHSQGVKLRRSGTYEVMDQENFEHKP